MKKLVLIAAAAMLTVSAFAQNLKFAHVNYNELVMLCPEADEARAAINASSKEADDTFQSMVDEYNTKLTQYQQNNTKWTATVKESKEKELMEIQNRIEEFRQNIQVELQQQQQQLMAPIQQKVIETVESLAKAGGYVYVFEQSSLLYVGSQSEDLTPAARKALGIPEGRTLETLQAELEAQQAQ